MKIPPPIISPHRTGFIENWHSFDIRGLANSLSGPSLPNTPEVILSLDTESAFDHMKWDSLFYNLKKFDFGHKAIS